MRIIVTGLKWLAAIAVVVVAGMAAWLYAAPPELIRVGSNYSAKIVCSNVFLAGRDADAVLADDVQAPGHPLLRLMQGNVDHDARTVAAGLFGLFGGGFAAYRDGLGCTVLPQDGSTAGIGSALAAEVPAAAPAGGLWPQGDRFEPSINTGIAKALDDPALTGPGMRAVMVVRDGRIAGERYGEHFSAQTPLLGWSMTKTVNAALLGTVVKAGRLSLERTGLLEAWKGDGRADISVADLMAMSSGLAFNEDYGDVSDVTRMLYLEGDMVGFAAGRSLEGPIGSAFNYSSGTALILSRIWQDALGSTEAALAWPRERLFAPIGMESAVFETDAAGTFAGSSYLYATARDWARFGLLLLQDGSWNGEAILPAGFVAWMREAAPASKGEYGRGQLWLHGPKAGTPEGQHPDAGFGLPEDTYWLIGHDGQTMAVVPSRRLVVLRMGLTPSKLGYKPQALLAAIVEAVDEVPE